MPLLGLSTTPSRKHRGDGGIDRVPAVAQRGHRRVGGQRMNRGDGTEFRIVHMRDPRGGRGGEAGNQKDDDGGSWMHHAASVAMKAGIVIFRTGRTARTKPALNA